MHWVKSQLYHSHVPEGEYSPENYYVGADAVADIPLDLEVMQRSINKAANHLQQPIRSRPSSWHDEFGFVMDGVLDSQTQLEFLEHKMKLENLKDKHVQIADRNEENLMPDIDMQNNINYDVGNTNQRRKVRKEHHQETTVTYQSTPEDDEVASYSLKRQRPQLDMDYGYFRSQSADLQRAEKRYFVGSTEDLEKSTWQPRESPFRTTPVRVDTHEATIRRTRSLNRSVRGTSQRSHSAESAYHVGCPVDLDLGNLNTQSQETTQDQAWHEWRGDHGVIGIGARPSSEFSGILCFIS